MAIQIDMRSLEQLDQDLADAVRQTPEIKRDVLTELGQQLLTQVRSNIGGTGKVRRWQHIHLGNRGGYVAIHPAENTTDEYGRAVGAVTNAIDSGHKIRPPGGKAKRYAPRIRKAQVPGKQMYNRADPETAADQAAATLALRLAQNLEG